MDWNEVVMMDVGGIPPGSKLPGNIARVEERIRQIKSRLEGQPSPFEKVLAEKMKGSGPAGGTSPGESEDDALRRVAGEMESLFINRLWAEMRKTVNKGGLLGEGTAVELFEGMLDENLSERMSEAGGIGLAQVIYEQLKSFQAARQDETD